ncbi:MAG: glycosyltransferase family 39 protein [Campylobacterota bacterium]|nr:glycosyltransferase family 39 protein [Campylobacterota bacterium]
MKTERSILYMHILSLVPAIAFFFIYAAYDTFSIVLLILLILLLSFNVYHFLSRKKIIEKLLLVSLLGSFFLYAFYGLGSHHVPETYSDLKDGDTVTLFSFKKPSKIDKMCYFVGINRDVHFVMEYQEKNQWKNFYSYTEKNFPYSYRWRCHEKKISTSKILLRITRNEMMLNEVRFMYKDKIIPFQTNTKNLNDEAHTTVDKSYYNSMFFDEIYHGRTAFEILDTRTIYENTHPYLGKIILMQGIKLFGMNPFGWRMMNVVFAGLMIAVFSLLAREIFKEKHYAYTAAFLMTYSFMHFTQSRLAHIDTFGVLFVITSYLFLYRFIVQQKLSLLLMSGVFFGLASAVKWSAVFASLGFVFIALYLLISKYPLQKRFSGHKLLLYGILAYGVVAITVYGFTFYDIYARTGSIQSIVDYNLNMFNYHSGIVTTHAYSSQWWSWMLNMKPMCYYRDIKDGLFSAIDVFGNPAIFWTGFVSMLYVLIVVIRKFSLEATFILLAFLGLYLPYIFVGRLMFIYHFYYAMPFMVLGILYMLRDITNHFSWYKKEYTLVYLGLVMALFLAFYPVLSGTPIAKPYVDDYLVWFKGWWL